MDRGWNRRESQKQLSEILPFENVNIKLLTDGFYRVADLDAEVGHFDGSRIILDQSRSRFFIREWQIALIAATEIDLAAPQFREALGVTHVVPYIGVKYSDVSGRLRQQWTASSMFQNPGVFESRPWR